MTGKVESLLSKRFFCKIQAICFLLFCSHPTFAGNKRLFYSEIYRVVNGNILEFSVRAFLIPCLCTCISLSLQVNSATSASQPTSTRSAVIVESSTWVHIDNTRGGILYPVESSIWVHINNNRGGILYPVESSIWVHINNTRGGILYPVDTSIWVHINNTRGGILYPVFSLLGTVHLFMSL